MNEYLRFGNLTEGLNENYIFSKMLVNEILVKRKVCHLMCNQIMYLICIYFIFDLRFVYFILLLFKHVLT